jgi:hypothetical protein
LVLGVGVICSGSLSAQQTLIAVGDPWTFFRGVFEPPAEWNQLAYDDSAWEMGPSGFGYGDNDDATVLTDMMGSYVSVYIRTIFTIADPSQVALLQLGMVYDDGFVAYLNGVEITRSPGFGTVGVPPTFDATAPDREVVAVAFTNFPAAAAAALRAGENVLAVQGHNTSIGSSDFSLIPQLRFFASLCPTTFTCTFRPADNSVRLTWRHVISPVPYESVDILRNGVFLANPTSVSSTSFIDASPLPCTSTYQLVATISGRPCAGDLAPPCTVMGDCPSPPFRRGDTDDNAAANLSDAVQILNFLFRGGTAPGCPDAADTDDSGMLNLTDAVFLLLHLFRGGEVPPAPGPTTCGVDPTSEDALGDCVYNSCAAQ